MCGRLLLDLDEPNVQELLHTEPAKLFEPQRFNVAPTQWVPAARYFPETRRRELMLLRWGLVPSWATELSVGNRMINARSEGVYLKASYKDAIRKRRCIIPAGGFYEWQAQGKRRQPYVIRRRDRKPLAIAGLWERAESVPEGPVETFTVLTTSANSLMQPLHERMPVLLSHADIERWLDPAEEDVLNLLKPYAGDDLEAMPVSDYVNNAAHEGPECLHPPSSISTASPVMKPKRKKGDAPGQLSLFD